MESNFNKHTVIVDFLAQILYPMKSNEIPSLTNGVVCFVCFLFWVCLFFCFFFNFNSIDECMYIFFWFSLYVIT